MMMRGESGSFGVVCRRRRPLNTALCVCSGEAATATTTAIDQHQQQLQHASPCGDDAATRGSAGAPMCVCVRFG